MSFLSAMWATLKGKDLPEQQEFDEHGHRLSAAERRMLEVERKLEIKKALRSLTGEET